MTGYLHLPAAYRSLSRPSSPLRAKVSTIRPYFLMIKFVLYDLLRDTGDHRDACDSCCKKYNRSLYFSRYLYQHVKDRS